MSDAEFLVKVKDAAALVMDACEEKLARMAPRESDAIPDLSLVIWKDAVSERGPFQIAEATSNAGNATFEQLTAYLRKHGGKCSISGFFAWLFSDSSGNVGRKAHHA